MAPDPLSLLILGLILVLCFIYLRRQNARLHESEDAPSTISSMRWFLTVESVRHIFYHPAIFTVFLVSFGTLIERDQRMPTVSAVYLGVICFLLGRITSRTRSNVIGMAFNFPQDPSGGEHVGRRIRAHWETGRNKDVGILLARDIFPRFGLYALHGTLLYMAVRCSVLTEWLLTGAAVLAGSNLIFFCLCLLLGRVEHDKKETAS